MEKSQYLCNRLDDFNEIWHGDTSETSAGTLKMQNWKIDWKATNLR